MFEISPALTLLDPPQQVVTFHRAATLAMLATLSDEELAAVGLDSRRLWTAAAFDVSLDSASRKDAVSTWEASRRNDPGWYALVAGLAPADEHWRLVVGAELTLWNSFVNESTLITGAVGARLGAILDALGIEITVIEITGLFEAICEGIAEGKTGVFADVTLLASGIVMGGAVGYLTGGAGIPFLTKAFEVFQGHLRSVDDSVRELALQYVLTDFIRDDEPDRVVRVVERMRESAEALIREGQPTRARMVLSAHDQLADSLERTEDSLWDRMPSVKGLRVDVAREVLATRGPKNPRLVDAVSETGAPERVPFMENRWEVRAQFPAEGERIDVGTVVVLAFARPAERTRSALVQLKVEEAASRA